MKQAHSDIYLMMLPTPLAEALCIIPADDEEELNKYCEMYLADFLRSVHNMTRSDTKVDSMEMEVHVCIDFGSMAYIIWLTCTIDTT